MASTKPDIIVHKTNEATAFVECSSSIHREITSYFSVFADNHRFNPKFKARIWDGKLRFFDYQNHLPIGLLGHLRKFAEKGGYTYHCKFKTLNDVSFETFKTFVAGLGITDDEGNPMEPRDYQLLAAYEAVRYCHLNVSSSTASGKSLCIYIIVRWLLHNDDKVLVIVPAIQLCTQLFQDFIDYSQNSEWNAQEYIDVLFSNSKASFAYEIITEDGTLLKFNENDVVNTKRGRVTVKHLKETDELIIL